ncbi:ABC1 kinase family protein [Pelomicrobium sp. G1]|jgi:ubiquinone biosynthesis protein|uniref:ABC1 kinase family protein n=1 Tax=unclassified Pelomicrobium TaxID=2815318 RepID=UPI003476F43C
MNEATPATAHLPVRELPRLAHILGVAAAQGFGRYVERLRLKAQLPGGPATQAAGDARRFRAALEELGPTFIKFGQALSVRQDLFAEEVIAELQQLQDRVPPFPAAQARAIVEEELGAPVSELFAAFDETPLAAASIAQVHHARLRDGTAAIVKVQRPGIEELIRADVEILRFLARLLARHVPEARRYDPPGLVDEFAERISLELDFLREGHNAQRFRADFRDEPAVYVPQVFWELSSRRVLTMEHSTGQRIGPEYPADAAERRRLAQTLTRLTLVQIYEHGFFHGDPHPGNVFILPDGRLCFHDFGIVGRLSRRDQENLRHLFLAVVARDAEWLADTYLDMGGVPAGIDRAAFVRDLGESLDRYYEASARGASFGEVLQQFIRLGSRYEIRLLRETLLVAKVFMILESVARTLDPQFDMIAAFERYAPGLLLRGLVPGIEAGRDLARAYRALSALRRAAGELPAALSEGLRAVSRGEARLRLQHDPLDSLERHIDRASNRLSFSLIIAAVVVGSSLVMAFHTGPHYEGIPLLGLIGYVIAALLGVAWAVAILRSGKF